MSNEAETKAVVPVAQKQVEFYGDELTAVVVDNNGRERIFVPIRPICDFWGVAWDPQRRRILRDPVLSKKIERVTLTVTDSYRTISREMICLPLDYLNGWLFGITADRVKSEVRDRVIRYQEECYQVLADAFQKGAETAEMSPSTTALVQIRETALAVAKLADEQLALTTRLNKAGIVVAGHEKRIRILEQRIDPGNPITDEQAAEVGQKVAALAMFLTERDNSKNHFQGIFSELHRQFKVTSYKLIPIGKYAAVLEFLDTWYEHAQRGKKAN